MMHFFLRFRALAAGLLLLACLPASAQTAERRTGLSLLANGLQYQGSFGSDYWKWSSTRLAPGVAISQYLTRGLDLHTQAFYGELSGRRNATNYFSTSLVNANLGLKLKLNNGWALKEKAFIQPYLLVMGGLTYVNRSGLRDTTRLDLAKGYVDLFGAAGLSLRLGGGVSLFVQTGQHLPRNANFEGRPATEGSQWSNRFLQHSVGLTFNLGQAPDADEDGVADPLDRCPNTPQGLEVTASGCPLDGDGDGVADYIDACPSVAGTLELRGCPDQDNDGVTDDEDTCPDTAGKAELHGCPDQDNDGVVDQDDKCPDTAAGEPVDGAGCPVQARTDAPPAPPADAANPDTDGDGVPNADDHCPTSAGPASTHGCPEIAAPARQRLREATRAIGFELNKATLLASSYPTLDALVPLLAQYPDYSLSIAGHTDSRGAAALNLTLSRARAAAARQYLLDRGVAADRIGLRGYGAQHPLADNATDAGRARNRRVEFDLYVTTEANSAEVKYGPEPKLAAPTKAVKTVKAVNPPKAGKAAPGKKAPAGKSIRPRKPAGPVRARRGREGAKKPATSGPASSSLLRRLGMPQR